MLDMIPSEVKHVLTMPNKFQADLAYPEWFKGVNTYDFRALLPNAFAQGAKECYKRCGLHWDNNTAGGIE